MGLGGGSASSSSVSKSGSGTSDIGSPYFQSSNPLNPATVRMPNNFNFAQQEDPDTYNKVQADRQQAQQRQSERLSEINQVYDATQGAGTSDALQQAMVERDRPKPTYSESIDNSFSNMANRLKGTIPRLNIVAADTWENVLGKELTKKWYEFEGRDIDQVRNNAYAELEQLAAQVKPTMGLTESIENNDWKGIASATVNAATSLGSTAIPSIATGGAALFTEMTGDALVDFNEAKAKKLGLSVDELYKQDKAEFGIPATIGALSGSLELYGMKGVKNLITDKIKGKGFKKALMFFGETQKEGLTEFVQVGLEEANRAMGEGFNEEEATKRAIDKMFSKQGLESYLQGVAGAGVAGGLGKLAKVISNPTAKKSFTKEASKVEELQSDLVNPNIDEQAKAVIAKEADNTVNKMADIVEKDIQEYDGLTPEQKNTLDDVNSQLDGLQSVVDNPNVSETTKATVQTQIDELLEANKDILKNKKELTEAEKDINSYKDLLDNQYNDTQVELLNKKRDELSTKYNVPTYEEVYQEVKIEANEGKGFFGKLKQAITDPFAIKREAEIRFETNLTNATEQNTEQSTTEAVQETKTPEPTETTTEVKETIVEPEIEPNEVKQPEDATKEVVEEDLPQKRTEEVLTKAEDDLKALKQVTDKTKKYDASMKRLIEAKNNKEITVAEFNDLKKRFDDVIGESTPKTQEVVEVPVDETVEVPAPAEIAQEPAQAEAPSTEVVEAIPVETQEASVETPVLPKKSKASDEFVKLAHKNIQSEEISNTLSNVERETGRELTAEEKEYNVTKRNTALNHGFEVVEAAKAEFGDKYVSELLNFLEENSSTMSIENKALTTISLELDLERQLQENPKDVTLNKQLKMVRDLSTKQQRSAAIATGYGILRQIARVGYDIGQVTDQFFSEQQLADKRKLTQAIESTSEDINKEADVQEGDTDYDPSEDFNVEPQPRKNTFGLTEQQQQEKAELAKQYRGVFNDVTRIATLLADKKFMRYAKLVLLDTAGDFESFAKSMIETVGAGIKEHLPTIYKKVGGTDNVTEKTEAQKEKAKSIKEIVKKALIDKGYGREITVNTKDADGKKVKEKRKVLDWKKLAGEEGSVDNIKANVENALLESGYSQGDITAIQNELVEEYNRLHASIIEKSLNELQSRNQEREPIETKTSAKRLAELYNYGLFNEESDTYDNLMNRALGLSDVGQKAFQEAKVLAKALSDIYRSTDTNGRRISEFGLKDAIRSINAEIERLLSEVAWEQSNMAFKVATVAKEFMGLSQRAMLQTVKQILENPLSGFIQRGFTRIGYSREGTDTDALKSKRSEAAKIVYEDIVRNAGLNYGEIITPFVTRGAFEKKLERMSDSKIYHTALSALLGRAYLDGADSMHKSALTERYFVHNLVRVLMKKGMPKEEAIEFVSNQLTGQKFTDALGSAKQIIDKANEDAGKKIINDNPNAIYRLAQNIVKDALVVGENITLREVESSYKAAYKAAGYDLGHEANNIISETVSNATTKLESSIKQAIKEKKWNHATALTFTSILTKNIINPFVSGGTNWIVLSLQKAGVDVVSPIVDYARQKENKLDLTTKEGVKNMENALLSEMRYKNTMNRVVIGAMASTLVAAAAIASGTDDDLASWLKKNDWAKKYFKVVSPQALIFLVAQENKQLADYLIGLFGFAYDSYSDSKKLTQAFQGLSADKPSKQEKGYRKLGEVFGGHTSFPTPWRVARDVENIYRGIEGKKPVKPDYNKGGFWDGYGRNGVIEYFMLER